MNGVRIIGIKEKLQKLQNVTINFVYNEAFIGEMQFRYQDLPANYKANHLIYEVERSKAKIEIIESLNKHAIEMFANGQLTQNTERSSLDDQGQRQPNLRVDIEDNEAQKNDYGNPDSPQIRKS